MKHFPACKGLSPIFTERDSSVFVMPGKDVHVLWAGLLLLSSAGCVPAHQSNTGPYASENESNGETLMKACVSIVVPD
ncbi:hypothetical protein DPMN_109536 [Dreissena polymorpha]|uniref:Uncharacterized protein n=1 Tax=Dreissena polymorpha TaxID=45954 RepID=A0A9D4KAR7_DREPO|nr:hypothetical protein DPMN_109536 [Dreissena polymorpha]